MIDGWGTWKNEVPPPALDVCCLCRVTEHGTPKKERPNRRQKRVGGRIRVAIEPLPTLWRPFAFMNTIWNNDEEKMGQGRECLCERCFGYWAFSLSCVGFCFAAFFRFLCKAPIAFTLIVRGGALQKKFLRSRTLTYNTVLLLRIDNVDAPNWSLHDHHGQWYVK